ncbi:MAG: peptide chain release factor-like protein [Coriobacteriales bacterium]|jgi:protein subunit release factor A
MGDSNRLSREQYRRLASLPPEELERQCEVEVFHATGPGGQGVNTSDSAVRMRHVPSGITVVSRESRSQLQNRHSCLRKLRLRFERLSVAPKARHATKPSRSQRQRRLDEKHRRSQTKAARGRVRGSDE